MNAGISPDAKEIIAEHCDWAFISMFSLDSARETITDIKARGAQHQRQLRCAGFPFVLWRASEDEALTEVQKIIANKDTVAVENWLGGLNLESGSFDSFTLDMMTLGAGAYPIIGTPEQVALKLKALYDLGLDGVLMVFQAYLNDTRRFELEIMPLLREMGVIAH